jgi:hypothetical protein
MRELKPAGGKQAPTDKTQFAAMQPKFQSRKSTSAPLMKHEGSVRVRSALLAAGKLR